MDLLNGLLNILSPGNLLYCFIGCVLGTLVGVLPGLGPTSTLAILLPITMYLDPTSSIIMLSGLYYGAMYGGSTTSILVNIPGEVASIVTCFDGFQMTKQGRAGEALWIAAVGSFIAGTLGAILISLVGPQIAKYAFKFGPPEYFGLLVFSLTILVSLSGTSLTRGLGAGLLGFFIAAIGVDPLSGSSRLNFGTIGLMRGIDIIPLAVGLFGVTEVVSSASEGIKAIYTGKVGRMMPRGPELKKGLKACFRGSALGLVLGMIPGIIPSLGSFLGYDLEKRLSKHPEKFGTGMIEGVANPEAANNAVAQAGFIPLITLGIPTAPSLAIIMAAFMMCGLMPGPVLFQTNKLLVWTVIASMYIGNVMLLVLNLPLVKFWALIALIPYKYLGPIVLAICLIGAYSPRNTTFDLWVCILFGVVGYVMRIMGWPVAPMILGFILGPMFEVALRQSLNMGGVMILVSRPISLFFIVLTIVVTLMLFRYVKRKVPAELVLEGDKEL
jgi:putative tricarboxylic transport membrane protein